MQNREMGSFFSRDLATIKLDCELDNKISDSEVGKEQIFKQEGI